MENIENRSLLVQGEASPGTPFTQPVQKETWAYTSMEPVFHVFVLFN